MKQRRIIDSDYELHVPEEIVTNILKRLPVKSLIRFQCVCQAWNNLIKTQSFITHHLHHSNSQNPCLIIESIPRLHLLDSTLNVVELQKSPQLDSFGDVSILGSCNGLVLLETIPYRKLSASLIVWNPATKEVTRVPLSTMRDCFSEYYCRTGFGFSSIVNDYAIIRFYGMCCSPVVYGEVFSFSRGSWKGVDVGELKGVRKCYVFESVTLDGAIFWTARKVDGDYVGVMVSFDIVNEVFSSMPIPDLRCSYNRLTIYENKVALLCQSRGVSRLSELWVLDEGSCASGRTWRWNKRYDIRRCRDTFGAWTVWRNHIVSKDYDDNVLFSRDLLTNEVKRFSVTYHGRMPDYYYYVESLVSVGNCFNEDASS